MTHVSVQVFHNNTNHKILRMRIPCDRVGKGAEKSLGGLRPVRCGVKDLAHDLRFHRSETSRR